MVSIINGRFLLALYALYIYLLNLLVLKLVQFPLKPPKNFGGFLNDVFLKV